MGGTAKSVAELPARPVATLRASHTLREMIGALVRHDVGLLVVMDDDVIRGVVSERDVIDAIYEGADIDAMTVADIVHTDVVEIPGQTSATDAARTMLAKRVRHLVVRDSPTQTGLPTVISLRDVVAPLVEASEN